MLAQKKVDGIVSAGNTGAMVAGGLFLRRFLKNVRRPGIAAVLPTIKGPSVMIDVGANVSPKAEHLFQYGVMGAIFARCILQREQPTIGLMNVGSEEAKGTDLAKETHALFNASPLKDRFVGNVEGRDLQRGAADVVVCDGFVGNVVLKTCEGVFEFLIKVLHKELLAGPGRGARPGGAGAARAGRSLRLQRLRRGAAAGHRRHLHHLPRQFGRKGDQERPRRRRPVRAGRAERVDRQGAGNHSDLRRAGGVSPLILHPVGDGIKHQGADAPRSP